MLCQSPPASAAPRVVVALLAAWSLGGAACKHSAADPVDGASDSDSKEVGLPACPTPDPASDMAVADDFGPDAKAVQMPSAMGRINVYEVTSSHLLERIDVYLRADLAGTRVTLSVYEAPSMAKPFVKLTDVQVDVPSCEGWASSGALAVPLVAGRFYAVGFDPNQLVTTFVSADMNDLPIDGHFGRLIGSKTVTTVSVPTQTWDKVSDKDFMRQRLLTSPVAGDDAGDDADDAGGVGDGDAGLDAGAGG
ncbi:MAG TPA: hypothetical protein VMU50_01730 [Polyangia bacterium]|nr:hypothetical protein [Polyangia bacterium]